MRNCRSCKAEIKWLKTRSGKNIPVNVPPEFCGQCPNFITYESRTFCKPIKDKYGYEPVNKMQIPSVNCPITSGETARDAVLTAIEFNKDYMIAHFATCPFANKWRKNK